ncbi:MAG: VWA domain-containing protein, partial [Acidobacteriota bacterium]
DSTAGNVAPPHDPGAFAPAASSAATSASQNTLGAMIFLIDFPGLDWRNKERFVSAWAELVDDTDSLAVPRAVYLIDQVGHLRELAPLTRDPVALREAVQQVRDEPLVRRPIHEQLLGLGTRGRTDGGPRDASAAEVAAGALDAPDGRIDERSRSLSTLELLTQFCNALTVRNGRTALVWVSSGLQTMEGGPFAALAAARWERNQANASFGGVDRSRRSGSTPFRYLTPDRRIMESQQELERAANSANVSIYAVDPVPQHEWRSIGTSVEVASASQGELLGGLTVQASLDGLRDSLRHAAADTGGRSFIGPSDLGRVIPEIEADSGRFYLLTYAAPSPRGDGEYHEISVEVSGQGLSVRARRGYVDTPAAQRAGQTIEAALAVPGAVSGLPVSARVVRRWGADGAPVVQLIAAVGVLPDPSRGAEPTVVAPLEIGAVAVDDEGDVSAEVRQEVVPRPAATPVAGNDRATTGGPGSAASRSFVYVHEWTLDPGAYDARIAVRDTASGLLGATRVPFEVPADSGVWRASDPLLLVVPPDTTPQPLAAYEIAAGEELAVQMEVGNGDGPVLSGELFNGAGTERIVQLPAIAMERDAAGVHRGVLRLRGMAPGSYKLQVSVTDRGAGKHAIQRLAVTVLDAG